MQLLLYNVQYELHTNHRKITEVKVDLGVKDYFWWRGEQATLTKRHVSILQVLEVSVKL